MTRFFRAIACLILLAVATCAQEIRVPSSPTGAGAVIRRLPWSEGNKTWILKPNAANSTLIISVYNRNTTNAHTFLPFLTYTPDEQSTTSVSNGWDTLQGITPLDTGISVSGCNLAPINVPANSMVQVCRYTLYTAKQVAFIITGAGTLAGSPDTFDLYYSFIPVLTVQFPYKNTAVYGEAQPGQAPARPPVQVGGTDAGGLTRRLLQDTLGRAFAVPVQGNTLLNAAPTVSAANTAATVTLAAPSGAKRNCIREIAIKATGAAATSTVVIQDNGVTFVDFGTQTIALNGPALRFRGEPLFCSAAANPTQVVVGAGGAAAVTTTSVVADSD